MFFSVMYSRFTWISRIFETYAAKLNIASVFPIYLSVFLMFFIILASIMLTYKVSKQIIAYFHNQMFNELYKAVQENDVLQCLSIIEKHPRLINVTKYPEGYTPFLIACSNANTQLVKFMVKKGADLRKYSTSNESPIYLTAFYYIQNQRCTNASCIWELYHSGADINAPNNKGITPLQMAAMFGHKKLVKWLLNKNASLISFPHPYTIAKSQGHQDVASLILHKMTPRISLQYLNV